MDLMQIRENKIRKFAELLTINTLKNLYLLGYPSVDGDTIFTNKEYREFFKDTVTSIRDDDNIFSSELGQACDLILDVAEKYEVM